MRTTPLPAVLVSAACCLGVLATSSVAAQDRARGYSAMPLTRVPPVFPLEALRDKAQALCLVVFDLTPEGSPTNLCATCEAGAVPEKFERASVETVAQWTYAPGEEGSPARVGVRTILEFAVSGEPLPADVLPEPGTVCARGPIA